MFAKRLPGHYSMYNLRVQLLVVENVVMIIGERVDGVRQQVALIIVARQTDFGHDARGDTVISRTKCTKPARRLRPMTEHVQVLFVGNVFFHVRFRHSLDLAIFFITGERRYRIHLGTQAAKLRRRYVGRIRFEFTQRAKVGGRVEWVRGFEIRSVQPSVRNCAELADEVFALDVTDEAVCISVTETQERRQQAIVVELVHNKLCKFEYGAADSDRLRENHLCAYVFHHRQIGSLMIDERL